MSGLLHPLAHQGTLAAVTVWPLLAAFLLLLTPVGRQRASSLTFAGAGAVMTLFAVWLIPGADALAAACSCVVALIPLLLPPASDRVGCVLPFLVTGCALMALNVHSAFAVVVLCGAGSVLLAWREGRGARKAAVVWDMVRARLGGVVLGVLGASLLRMGEMPLGMVFLAVGLCMMAGYGPSPVVQGQTALLDTGLRFAAVMMMFRLQGGALAHWLVLVGGLGTVVLRGMTYRARDGEILPILAGLAGVAASVQEGAAVVLLLVASLGLAVLEREGRVERYDALAVGMVPWPVFCALVAVGRSLNLVVCGVMVVSLLPVLARVSVVEGMPVSGRGEALWRRGVEGVLLLVGICGPLFLMWHPVVEWRP